MAKILILGAGAFGRRAQASLQKAYTEITMVDREQAALDRLAGSDARLVRREAAAFLAGSESADYDWIIPALPVHLALEWLRQRLLYNGVICRKLPIPSDLKMPNPYNRDGTLYTSVFGHLCPQDCPEPPEFCYLTGERRQPLFELLSELSVPGCTVEVVRSHQLGPGVGGIRPESLQKLYETAVAVRGKILVATVCSCHGVLDLLRID